MVAWLSGLQEKNLNGCGRLVLTGGKAKSEKNWMTSVDMSNMDSLEDMQNQLQKELENVGSKPAQPQSSQ